MLAFRPYDTNNTMQLEKLNMSPPSKKCAKSPGKVPLHSDLLYHAGNTADEENCFKFNLQSVTVSSYSDHPVATKFGSHMVLEKSASQPTTA